MEPKTRLIISKLYLSGAILGFIVILILGSIAIDNHKFSGTLSEREIINSTKDATERSWLAHKNNLIKRENIKTGFLWLVAALIIYTAAVFFIRKWANWLTKDPQEELRAKRE